MNDRAAFDAYFEDHHDDVAGLLGFADWLDEHGESREAEFTREMARRKVWPQRLDRPYGLWHWWPVGGGSTQGGSEFAFLPRGVYDATRRGGGHLAGGSYFTRRDAVADLYRVWLELGDAVWAEPAEVFGANV